VNFISLVFLFKKVYSGSKNRLTLSLKSINMENVDRLEKIWRFKDLRNKILVAIGLLIVTRILAHIPLPGVDLARLQGFFEQNQAFGLLNMFSGGTMQNFSIALMGVGPYITSSIIFQLLAMIFPS
jgi:preprotein translocase subunit SecY